MEKIVKNRFKTYERESCVKPDIIDIVKKFPESKIELYKKSLVDEGLLNLIFDSTVVNFEEQDYYKSNLRKIFPADIVEGSLIQWVMAARDPDSIKYTDDFLIVRMCFLVSVLVTSCRGSGTVDENYYASYLSQYDEEMGRYFSMISKNIALIYNNVLSCTLIEEAKKSMTEVPCLEEKITVVNCGVGVGAIEEVPYDKPILENKEPLIFPCSSSGIVRIVCDHLSGKYYQNRVMYQRIRGVNRVLTRYSDIKSYEYYRRLLELYKRCDHGKMDCLDCLRVYSSEGSMFSNANYSDLKHAEMLLYVRTDDMLEMSYMGLPDSVMLLIMDRMAKGLRRFSITFENEKGEEFFLCKCQYHKNEEKLLSDCRRDLLVHSDVLSGFHTFVTSMKDRQVREIVKERQMKFYEMFDFMKTGVVRRRNLDNVGVDVGIHEIIVMGEYCPCEQVW